ncbi:hypothetical protein [Tengunoibacter tsumagoiensis]|uniref:Uncharacterized protein n=1 Tax=Tengunoibacter tsumagoiensis TaxID=2014871 RepID=A0A401ZYG3_9CHLR|nr:hypothetical protein [Tengunoibacter tsumagoiensis]GCE11862.1 hypothetical protein KTT_17210 [Tengunoibacter tsumagoiensis]
MGVERAVTLWYIQRQFILEEIALLQAQQDSLIAPSTGNASQADGELHAQLLKAMAKLRALGPCPKPMMG